MQTFAGLRTGICDRSTAFAVAVHGGASQWGGATPEQWAERAQRTQTELRLILRAAERLLGAGATALDVVEACVRAMEDSGVFNAGRGATINKTGAIELDAAIMDGATGRAGGIGAVRRVRNPVNAARIVMEQSPHVLLVGPEAESFVAARGAVVAEDDYFTGPGGDQPSGDTDTVGAVALDRNGCLAAATSTGGIRGKLPGRLGDAPLIGAGTFADQRVAVSGTGQGEYFMRMVLAHEVAAMMAYRGMGVREAVAAAIRERLGPAGGYGGLIAVDRDANVAMEMNTAFMPRGFVTHLRELVIATGCSCPSTLS